MNILKYLSILYQIFSLITIKNKNQYQSTSFYIFVLLDITQRILTTKSNSELDKYEQY